VLSLCQNGFANSVASLGTSFNAEHVRTLKRYCESVVLLFDSDAAGDAAAAKAIPVIEAGGLKVKVLQLKDAKDPDEFLKNFGPGEFNERLSEALSSVSYTVGGIKGRYDLSKTDDKVAFTTDAAGVLSKMTNMIERDAYIKDIASETGISRDAIATEVDKLSLSGAEPRMNRDSWISYAERGLLNERGVIEAVKTAIYLAASSERLCEVIKEHLDASELPAQVYSDLLKIVYSMRENGRHIYGAELVSNFENIEEQKIVSDIFATADIRTDGENMDKTLTELIKKIKLYRIERGAGMTGDINELKKLAEMKRDAGNLTIKL